MHGNSPYGRGGQRHVAGPNSKMGNSAAVLAVEASITPAALTKAPGMVRENVGLALCEVTELRERTELEGCRAQKWLEQGPPGMSKTRTASGSGQTQQLRWPVAEEGQSQFTLSWNLDAMSWGPPRAFLAS